jgi:hypothetical protein
MTDWAGQAAQRTLEKKRLHDQGIERANRVTQIKAEAGPRLFKQLFDWLNKQVATYNDKLAQGSDEADELVVNLAQSSKPAPEMPDSEIVIVRRGGKKEPLKIWYSAVRGILSYECEGRREEFVLYVGDDDQPFFKTESDTPQTIEEIGTEALNKFLASKR